MERLTQLAQERRLPLTVDWHDHFLLCPVASLMGGDDYFCGLPDTQVCADCLPANAGTFDSALNQLPMEDWRAQCGALLARATRIRVFSQSSAELLRRVYGDRYDGVLAVEPHNMDYFPLKPLPIATDTLRTIGVIGQIGLHKGAAVVVALAEELRRRGLDLRIVVIGTLELAYPRGTVHETGAYEQRELPELLAREGVDMVLFPSVCPETFSFVVHEVMRMEMPLAALALGAQGEAVAGYKRGLLLEDRSPASLIDALLAFAGQGYRSACILSGSQVRVFTSAARNYLPKVRLLFESLERHHPEWRRTLVLVERDANEHDRDFSMAHEVLAIPELAIPDWEPWSFCHTLVELATAVKPFALQALLDRDGTEAVLYFDPDIAVYSPLDDVIAAFDEASVLLTPHQLAPEVQLGRVMDNEISSLVHGVYNLGFLGVAADAQGRAFAEWWGQRLYRFCRDDRPHGLFTDQKWIDLVPALFAGVGVLRSPRLNVASWNVSRRELSLRDGVYLVGEELLGFYHFTSVSTDSHRLMVLKNSDGNAAVAALLDEYEAREGAVDPVDAAPWSLGHFGDGDEIKVEERIAYRDRPELQQRYPLPFTDVDARAALRECAVDIETVAIEPLSPGYGEGDDAVDGEKLRRLLIAAATDLRSARMLARRTLSVLTKEGVGGVMKRLR